MLATAIATASLASIALVQAERFLPSYVKVEDQIVELGDFGVESQHPDNAYLQKDGTYDYSQVNLDDDESNYLSNLGAYNEGNAGVSVRFAAASYCTRGATAKLNAWNCKVCKNVANMQNVETFHNAQHNTNGYVGYDAGRNLVVVAYAGTDPSSWKNIFTDLNTFAVNYHGVGCGSCKVHAGFYNAYMHSRSTVIALIKKKMRSGARVLVTGHSLGGALAAHLVADLQNASFFYSTADTNPVDENGEPQAVYLGSDNPAYEVDLDDLQAAIETENPNIPMSTQETLLARIHGQTNAPDIQATRFNLFFPVYTFGQPRLGNLQFSNWFKNSCSNKGVFRVTHHRDPVPHLPPLAFQYQHPTNEVFYTSDQRSFKVCPQAEDKSCSNQFAFVLGFTDHMSYVKFPVSNTQSNC